MRGTVSLKRMIHRSCRAAILAATCNPAAKMAALQSFALVKIDSCSVNHPEVARNHVRDPCDVIGQSLASRAARLHRHNEQIRFHRLHEVGRGKASVAAKAARL